MRSPVWLGSREVSCEGNRDPLPWLPSLAQVLFKGFLGSTPKPFPTLLMRERPPGTAMLSTLSPTTAALPGLLNCADADCLLTAGEKGENLTRQYWYKSWEGVRAIASTTGREKARAHGPKTPATPRAMSHERRQKTAPNAGPAASAGRKGWFYQGRRRPGPAQSKGGRQAEGRAPNGGRAKNALGGSSSGELAVTLV